MAQAIKAYAKHTQLRCTVVFGGIDMRPQTAELKRSGQAEGAELITSFSEWTGTGLLSLASRLATVATPFNMVITNVPGPRRPLYLLGSRMRVIHPHVPLMGAMGLGIALFSYDGKLHIGLNADYEMVPDLSTFTALFAQAFMTLADASGVREEQVETVAAPPHVLAKTA